MNKEEFKHAIAVLSLKRKPIVDSYDGFWRTRNLLTQYGRNNEGSLSNLATFINGAYLDPYFMNPGSRLPECAQLSETLYATNRIYQSLIDYLTNLYYWRYVTTPRKVKSVNNTGEKEDYQKVYRKMLELVDGLNIEVTFPRLLLSLFLDGRINIYCNADKSSKGVATILLPNKFCRPVMQTQYGTTQIQFDCTFFDILANDNQDLEKIFSIFPVEFKELYDEYRRTNNKWQLLNPKLSTCIDMNNVGFPTFLSVFYDLIDYKNYKLNELDRNTNGLERIITQEINPKDTEIELPEISELHESMEDKINGNGTTLLTSPGHLDVKQLQADRAVENKVLANAYKSIFNNAGFNDQLFTGDIEYALKASIYRDLNYVWNYIEQLTTFFNLALNNVFSFSSYQLSFRILPLSQFNEKDKLELYHQNATLGVGLVDLLVATGIKQVDIESTIEMEQFLDLSNRLVPLQSAHTQSSSTSAGGSGKEQTDKNNPDGKKDGQSNGKPADSKKSTDTGKSDDKSSKRE